MPFVPQFQHPGTSKSSMLSLSGLPASTLCDCRRIASASATILDYLPNAKDFLAQQAQDLTSGIGIPVQQSEESSTRNEIQTALALGRCRQAVRLTGERSGKTQDRARPHGCLRIETGRSLYGELDLSTADQECSAARLAKSEQNGAFFFEHRRCDCL